MIEKFLRFLRGYVQILVSGTQLERFLNLCKSRRISLERISCQDASQLTAFLSIKDFFQLRPIRNKSKVHIRVLKKRGLPFFFYKNKKRKAFFLGIVLSLFVMAMLSSRIWNIHIEGNRRNTTPEILKFLEKEGITHGMAKSTIDCEKIVSLVRQKYQDIAWASAKIQGTRLILTVQEGILAELKEDVETPCNLTADKEGTIVEMITRQGIPLVHPGDVCKIGDLLVSGELPITNDNQVVIRYAYVKADADIFVRRVLSYHQEFPLKYQKQIPTGKKKYGISLFIGPLYLELYPKEQECWRKKTEFMPLQITENFFLPIIPGRAVFTEYQKQQAIYTKEQAETLALEKLHLYEEKLLEKDIQISENNVKIKVTNTSCTAKGSLTVIEKIGRETPVEQKEQPSKKEISEETP